MSLSSLSLLPEYTTILSQCVVNSGTASSRGPLLVVGTQAGQVMAAAIDKLVERRSDDAEGDKVDSRAKKNAQPIDDAVVANFFVTGDEPVASGGAGPPNKKGKKKRNKVLSMASQGDNVVVGSVGALYCFAFDRLTTTARQDKAAKKIFTIGMSGRGSGGGTNLQASPIEVTSILVDGKSGTAGRIIAGCSDNIVHVFDMETRRRVFNLKGHTNYIHNVTHNSASGLIASASEDGTVRLWDTRQRDACTATLNPNIRPALARPKCGKWIGAAALTQDWVVCGGGPRTSIWHIRTQSPQDPLPPHDDSFQTHVIDICGERIFMGGRGAKNMYQCSLQGDLLAEVPVSSSVVYSLAWHDGAPARLLSIAGSSSRVDLCSPNFAYRDRTVAFPLKA